MYRLEVLAVFATQYLEISKYIYTTKNFFVCRSAFSPFGYVHYRIQIAPHTAVIKAKSV